MTNHADSQPEGQAGSPSARLLAMLRRRWWIIGLIVAGAVGITLLVALNAPTIYRSSMRLQVLALDDEEVTLYTRLPTENTYDRIIVTQNSFAEVLRSPLVAWRTIGDLGLEMSTGELLSQLDVSVSFEFVDVAYSGETAQEARDVLARQAQNAIDEFNALQARPASATGRFIEAELAEQAQALSGTQEALLAFQVQYGVGDLAREINAEQDLLRELEAGRDAALVEAERAATLATQWRAFADDAQASAQAAQASLDALATGETGAEEPAVDGAQIAALQAEIDDQLALARNYGTTALTQEAAAAAQEAAAARQEIVISQRQADLAQLIGLSSQYNKLWTGVQNAQADLEFLRAKAVEARLKERQASEVGPVQISQPPFLPPVGSRVSVLPLLLLALLVSLIVGVLVVLALEVVSPTPASAPVTPDK